jgi:hypothetical protein
MPVCVNVCTEMRSPILISAFSLSSTMICGEASTFVLPSRPRARRTARTSPPERFDQLQAGGDARHRVGPQRGKQAAGAASRDVVVAG